MASIIGFMKRTKEWIAAAHISDQQKENAPLKKQPEPEEVLQDGVQPDDSASQTGVHNPGQMLRLLKHRRRCYKHHRWLYKTSALIQR
ncbi:hypothetical protein AAFF_G00296670 [Aldrovandia affinis]|uniref:Uncharacterized protein n=1 Tax=Aldrovandia affinis TaxID=143900 RepID=A0AAD7WRI0_9TELE|nr:hypothetical protein AAFF_G00296670 [Aldrovandia affinis]